MLSRRLWSRRAAQCHHSTSDPASSPAAEFFRCALAVRWPIMRRVRIRAVRALLLVATAVALASCARQRTLQTITGLAQGTTYTLQCSSQGRVDSRALTAAVTAELERLDALLSNYRADSVLERFN